MSFSLSNMSKPAPKWFRKTKRAIHILIIAANSMVASWGIDDEILVTRVQLWCTIGIVAVLEALETFLANGEEYTELKNKNNEKVD